MFSTKALGGAHLLGYSLVFGATCYQSFYAGIMAYKALNLDNFSALQNRLFPGYFGLQTAGSAFLMLTVPFVATRCHKVALGISLVSALINLVVILPKSQRVSAARAAQAAAEGKSWRDPEISDELRALNKQFGHLHRISVLLNFATVFSLGYYGIKLGGRL
ncbi:hypothetical protein B9G98_00872 [Wickerhamiella sorbophila]|uniref:TMEM205-like domain-containing protein n=1 Tax=Wickerhamiella sorbophila TaxID=45607 RepID=A0A2T0FE30_9ASCO|nr:hypothetical protein B9G98_00872 [Wickerhamiella sorbophila]PRT53252.1 hypothetical protein B9G98_00872 [Wickerhamiella sorbophila]